MIRIAISMAILLLINGVCNFPFSVDPDDFVFDGTLSDKNTISCSSKINTNNDPPEWTYMLYDDADFTASAYDPLEDDFSDVAFSGENLNMVVLQDPLNGPAKMWYIDENHQHVLLEDLGEINMGEYATLKTFIAYCKEQYPAERYLLAMFNHGAGWRGACVDETNDNDLLTMDEIQTALVETGGVDIICFTAPCVMAALESMYELRDVVDVYIGSEDSSLFVFWWYSAFDIRNMLNNETSLSNIEIGEKIIEIIDETTPGNWRSLLTMSAMRTDKINALVFALEDLCKSFLSHMRLSTFGDIKSAHEKAFQLTRHPGVDEEQWEIYDFYGFIQNLEGFDEEVERVSQTFDEAVIAECHGLQKNGCHGLSIYFPDHIMDNRNTISYRSSSLKLDFPRDTHWDEFLSLFVLANFILK